MDRGKRASKFLGNSNNKMYLDLKDIVRESALSFLPAKSLLKFRTVCRDWKLQISTPFFAHNQSISFKRALGIFGQSPGKPPLFISLDPKSCGLPDPSLSFLPEPVNIRSSSNGLICCQGHTGYKAYYVCNPVTKQFVKIPKQSANHGPDSCVALVFEPSRLNFVAEFKLICPFASEEFENAMEFDVYSSSEGRWKISSEIWFESRRLVACSGVHAKGVVYWQMGEHGMVAFDLKKDKFQVLGHGYSSLSVIDGKLCKVYVMSNTTTINVTPVIANAYYSAMPMGSSSYQRTPRNPTRSFTLDRKVLEEVRHQRLDVLVAAQDMVVLRAGDTILCYDMMKNKTKVVGKLTSGFETMFLPYVNSLVYL